jgi:hypothetical protein
MNLIAGTSVASILCLTLVACSETTVMDKMGLGKNPPDETQVVSNNNLAMPPDLQLRPPSTEVTSEAQSPSVAAAVVPATPPAAFANAAVQNEGQVPGTAEVATAEPTPYDTGEQQLDTFGNSTTASGAQPAVQTTAKRDLNGARQDAYQKFGISKTRPDGTPKSQAELDRELLEAVRREKRKQNPNYGTVFNIGDLFKGD